MVLNELEEKIYLYLLNQADKQTDKTFHNVLTFCSIVKLNDFLTKSFSKTKNNNVSALTFHEICTEMKLDLPYAPRYVRNKLSKQFKEHFGRLPTKNRKNINVFQTKEEIEFARQYLKDLQSETHDEVPILSSGEGH